jgi:hypothetical protein
MNLQKKLSSDAHLNDTRRAVSPKLPLLKLQKLLI